MPKMQGYWILHEGLIGVIGEPACRRLRYTDAAQGRRLQDLQAGTGGWLGITDKYWAAALIPDQKTPYEARLTRRQGASKGSLRGRLPLGTIAVAAGRASAPTTNNLFAGAKQIVADRGLSARSSAPSSSTC